MTTAPLLAVDPAFAFDDRLGVGRGIARADFAAQAATWDALPAWAEAESAGGRLAFLDLPLDTDSADEVATWCEGAPAATDIVITGIGGSALGARVFDALRTTPDAGPRLHVLDTVDPDVLEHRLRTLDPTATVLFGVSKSGSTLEATAGFLLFEAWMRRALGDAAGPRIAVVCGPHDNPFRRLAAERGYATFLVPEGVGGRYSALTPVGLLPAACAGVPPRRLLEGAAWARAAGLRTELDRNPALLLAAVHHAAARSGRSVAVLWPYGNRLRPLGPWWAQLLGESLGKPGAAGPAGITPLAASGPADQHSLLQLLVEGPDDKLVVFVEAPTVDGPRVPENDGSPAGGQTLGAILRAEAEGTRFALTAAGRPSLTVRLGGADAASVGAFLLTYELATVYWARLLGVDPFGQPGVELGKDAARARLTGEPEELAKRMDEQARLPRTRSP